MFPWKDELLDGLFGNDVLGFHLRYHCANFLETVDRGLEALVDAEHGPVIRGGHSTTVRSFPISVDFDEHVRAAADPKMAAATACVDRESASPEILGIGIDRVDYTKGISERLEALDSLLEEHPEYAAAYAFFRSRCPAGLHPRLREPQPGPDEAGLAIERQMGAARLRAC